MIKDSLCQSLRSVPNDKVHLLAADIAELVLPIYENMYPNDNRPRKGIENCRNRIKDGTIGSYEAAYASGYANVASDHKVISSAYAAANAASVVYNCDRIIEVVDYALSANPEIEEQIESLILKYKE